MPWFSAVESFQPMFVFPVGFCYTVYVNEAIYRQYWDVSSLSAKGHEQRCTPVVWTEQQAAILIMCSTIQHILKLHVYMPHRTYMYKFPICSADTLCFYSLGRNQFSPHINTWWSLSVCQPHIRQNLPPFSPLSLSEKMSAVWKRTLVLPALVFFCPARSSFPKILYFLPESAWHLTLRGHCLVCSL